MKPTGSVRIESIDGGVYTGVDLTAALDVMRKSSWGNPGRTLQSYMVKVAARCADWNKATVRTDSVDNFVADLQVVGLIRVVYEAAGVPL
jgi:hypothetical protein